MSAQTNANITHTAQPATASMMYILAVGAGLSVASIYYAQPMLPLMGTDLSLSINTIGLIPTLTQMGYALGLFFLIPLGDRYDRRSLIGIKSLFLVLMLIVSSMAGNSQVLLLSSLLVGLGATMTQDLVPAATLLAPAGTQGQAVGKVMTGLLLGILLSRVVSGLVGEYISWRAMFILAAAAITIIGILLWRKLPSFPQHSNLTYPELLRSMWHLWIDHKTLRRAAVAQGLLSLSFSAFWSTLALMLHDQFQLGSAVAGTFGIAGAAGALAAPLSGSLSDRFGAIRITQFGAALVTLSFTLMFALPLLSTSGQLILIAITAIGFDLGVQATLVAHQTLVYGIAPQSRGRINALLFTSVFIGMSSGSAIGAHAYAAGGWVAVTLIATIAGFLSLLIRLRKCEA